MINLTTESTKLFFGDEGQGIARYDQPRYPVFQKVNKRMRSFFWEPEAITLSGERRSFNSMTDSEQFMFTSNLQRVILLDTMQGRAPVLAFGRHCTDPTLENAIVTWQFFETIHSESYTHILRAVYPDPSKIVDAIPGIQPIADCASSINLAYDRQIANPSKENLYLALVAANALEALRFYDNFAGIFSLKKRLLMPGSGDIVKLIARDEIIHLGFVTHILKTLPKDDPEFITIAADLREQAIAIFHEAAEQEKVWAEYMLSMGPIIGLTLGSMLDYIDHREIKSTNTLGLTNKKVPPMNLPYMDEYIKNADKIQAAPQEDGALEYLSASMLFNDLEDYMPRIGNFKRFKLPFDVPQLPVWQ